MLKKFNKLSKIARNEGLDSAASEIRSHIQYKFNPSDSKNFHYRTKFRYYWQQHTYSAPSYPYKIIHINPDKIKYYHPNISHKKGVGQIIGEDLADGRRKIDNHWIYKGLRQRFVENRDWKDTIYHQTVENKYDERRRFWGYDTIEQFHDQRLRYIDELFDEIKNSGFKPNYVSGHNVPAKDKRNNEIKYRDKYEPFVIIDECGDIYWRNGFHRLSIAVILNIDSIPVHVLARHENWQMVRDRIYESIRDGIALGNTDHINHPDMNDIIS